MNRRRGDMLSRDKLRLRVILMADVSVRPRQLRMLVQGETTSYVAILDRGI